MYKLIAYLVGVSLSVQGAYAGGFPSKESPGNDVHTMIPTDASGRPCLSSGKVSVLSEQAQDLGACTQKITDAVSPTVISESYPTFDSILNRFKKDPCHLDKKELRKSVLMAMKEAFRFRGFPEQEISEKDWKSESRFQNKLAELWTLFGALISKDPAGSLQDLVLHIMHALESGAIPVPNRGHPEHFTYTSLREYFPLNIIPVSIDNFTEKELSQRDEHPILYSFLESQFLLLDHDIQHADILGTLHSHLGLNSPKKCEKFIECLRSIPGESDRNSLVRKAIYYLLHEDNNAITRERSGFEPKRTFVEFALENTLNKKGLSTSELMGENTPEFEAHARDICAAVTELKRDKTLRQSLFRHIIPESEFQKKIRSISWHTLFGKETIEIGMLGKMAARCRQYTFSGGLPVAPNSKAGIVLLTASFQNAKTNSGTGFADTFLNEISRLYDGIYTVLTHISAQDNPACSKFNFPNYKRSLSLPFSSIAAKP